VTLVSCVRVALQYTTTMSHQFNQVALSVISKKGALNVKRDHLNRTVYLTDPFHTLVDTPWIRLLFFLSLACVLCWAFFAVLFEFCGDCIAGAHLGYPFLNSFFFSMQTMTTIGFGEMHPTTVYSNTIVAIESLVGILFSSTLFGIIFVKFSRPQTRCESIIFSNIALISKRDGKTCLIFRILNVRKHMLVHPKLSLFFVSNATTMEGEDYIKFHKLEISNSNVPFLGLPWTVIHCIDEKSPLYNQTIESLHEVDAEIMVILEGMDASSAGAFQSRYYYTSDDFRINARFVDIVTKCADKQFHVDHARFHDYVMPSYQVSS